MKISTFVIRVWRFLSMLLAVGAVGFSYLVLPTDVGVHFDSAGKADEFMSKNDIFYFAVAIVIVNNVLIMALAKKILTLPSHLLPIPNQTEWSAHREEFNMHLKSWFYCLIASINTIFGFMLLALGTVNSNQFKFKLSDFSWLFYMTIVMLLIVGIALPVRLMMKPNEE